MHTTPLDADSSFLTDAYIMKGLSGLKGSARLEITVYGGKLRNEYFI